MWLVTQLKIYYPPIYHVDHTKENKRYLNIYNEVRTYKYSPGTIQLDHPFLHDFIKVETIYIASNQECYQKHTTQKPVLSDSVHQNVLPIVNLHCNSKSECTFQRHKSKRLLNQVPSNVLMYQYLIFSNNQQQTPRKGIKQEKHTVIDTSPVCSPIIQHFMAQGILSRLVSLYLVVIFCEFGQLLSEPI